MAALDDDLVEPARTVRPYTVTGGRTRTRSATMPLEALVRARGSAPGGGAAERRRIVELSTDQVMSVAELSALLGLPLGVTRVLVGDLADEGLVAVHGGSTESFTPATDLEVLESVRHGISAL